MSIIGHDYWSKSLQNTWCHGFWCYTMLFYDIPCKLTLLRRTICCVIQPLNWELSFRTGVCLSRACSVRTIMHDERSNQFQLILNCNFSCAQSFCTKCPGALVDASVQQAIITSSLNASPVSKATARWLRNLNIFYKENKNKNAVAFWIHSY